jgi:fluoroquinolone transport system permease protein
MADRRADRHVAPGSMGNSDPHLVLVERFAFDLTPYYPLVASFLTLMVPTLMGAVVGFLLLDHRDDRTLTALQVTPLTVEGYLLYRISIPMAVSVAVMMLTVPVAGLVRMGFVPALLASLQAAPIAPIYALFVAAFAANKVQGFALLKAAGVLTWPPILAYFVSSNWQIAFGIDPLYWPVKVFWMLEAGEPGVWPYYVAGLAYQASLTALLLKRFMAVIHR